MIRLLIACLLLGACGGTPTVEEAGTSLFTLPLVIEGDCYHINTRLDARIYETGTPPVVELRVWNNTQRTVQRREIGAGALSLNWHVQGVTSPALVSVTVRASGTVSPVGWSATACK